MARGYRLGTPKGAVQFEFGQHGEAAARVKAVELGVEKKLNRWIEEWTEKRDPSPKGGGVIEGRRRVRELGHPKQRRGTVIEEGTQVSQVRWDNGDVRYVSNVNLITQVRKGSA